MGQEGLIWAGSDQEELLALSDPEDWERTGWALDGGCSPKYQGALCLWLLVTGEDFVVIW